MASGGLSTKYSLDLSGYHQEHSTRMHSREPALWVNSSALVQLKRVSLLLFLRYPSLSWSEQLEPFGAEEFNASTRSSHSGSLSNFQVINIGSFRTIVASTNIVGNTGRINKFRGKRRQDRQILWQTQQDGRVRRLVFSLLICGSGFIWTATRMGNGQFPWPMWPIVNECRSLSFSQVWHPLMDRKPAFNVYCCTSNPQLVSWKDLSSNQPF